MVKLFKEITNLFTVLRAKLCHDTEFNQETEDWKAFLDRTYGILADAPIQRWPQGEYEERDSVGSGDFNPA